MKKLLQYLFFIFFEKWIFLLRHYAILKNLSLEVRNRPKDCIDTSFVQIGQEMGKLQRLMCEKSENRLVLHLKSQLRKGGWDMVWQRFDLKSEVLLPKISHAEPQF